VFRSLVITPLPALNIPFWQKGSIEADWDLPYLQHLKVIGFKPWAVYVAIVKHNIALGQVPLPALFIPASVHATNAPYTFIIKSW
jgi:hypothetical protein